MGSSDNGITQSPFSDVWSTPDVSGTGANGIGNGFDSDSGPNGIVNSPFSQVWPTPGMEGTPCAELGGRPPDTVTLDGGSPKGSQLPTDTVVQPPHTVDRR